MWVSPSKVCPPHETFAAETSMQKKKIHESEFVGKLIFFLPFGIRKLSQGYSLLGFPLLTDGRKLMNCKAFFEHMQKFD